MKFGKTGRQLNRIDTQLAAAERLLAIVLRSDSCHRYNRATLDGRAQEALRKINQAREEARRALS